MKGEGWWTWSKRISAFLNWVKLHWSKVAAFATDFPTATCTFSSSHSSTAASREVASAWKPTRELDGGGGGEKPWRVSPVVGGRSSGASWWGGGEGCKSSIIGFGRRRRVQVWTLRLMRGVSELQWWVGVVVDDVVASYKLQRGRRLDFCTDSMACGVKPTCHEMMLKEIRPKIMNKRKEKRMLWRIDFFF